VRILILTEDGADKAPTTLQHVIVRLLRAAFPGIDTSKLVFIPRSTQAARSARANKWKSNKREDERDQRILTRDIATQVTEVDSFVFFHFDGDTPWSQRSSALTSGQFEEKIIQRVNTHAHQQKRGRIADFSIQKIIPLVPYYAIEAWLFQNVETCRKLTSKPSDLAVLDKWHADRGQLDELVKPHQYISFAKIENSTLAETLSNATVSEVEAVGKSLAVAVEAMRNNSFLAESAKKISSASAY
jgi:hypothetical protein